MRFFTATCVPLAFFALLRLPATLRAAEPGSPRPLVIINPHCQSAKSVPLSEEVDLTIALRQLRRDFDKCRSGFDEETRSLRLDYTRGLITADQARVRLARIRTKYDAIIQNIRERRDQLELRATALEKAPSSVAEERQSPGLDGNERAVLNIFDVAEREGKVPAEWLIGAREIVRSGTYDAKSLAHVATALAFCLSQLVDNEEERTKYLRIAQEACAEYAKLDKGAAPEAENLSSLVQQLQNADPRSAEFQKRAAEIGAKMKATMDSATNQRRAVIAELEKKAADANRRAAEIDGEIAAMRERMKERKRRMDAMGY